MSESETQLQAVEDLDASVETLMQDIEASSARVGRTVREVAKLDEPAIDAHDTPTTELELPASDAAPKRAASVAVGEMDFVDAGATAEAEGIVDASGAVTAEAVAPAALPVVQAAEIDALLASAADEIEDAAKAEEAAAAAEAARVAEPVVAEVSAATDAKPETKKKADPIAELDDAFASAEDVIAAEAAPATPAGDAAKLASLEDRANQPPIADIEQLDKALAASADAEVAKAEAAAKPVHHELPPVAVAAAASVAAASVAANVRETVLDDVEDAKAEPKRSVASRVFGPVGAGLATAVMPLNKTHAKLSEQTRQTIAYIAIMNVFFASVVWFMAMRPKPALDVEYDVKQLYMTEVAAKEAEHAAHAAAKKDDGHGGGGHGEAKKDDGHGGGGGHGAADKKAKKTAAKKPDKKKAAAKKDDGHGGGH